MDIPNAAVAMSASLGAAGLLLATGSVAGDGKPNVAMSVIGLTIGVAGFTTAGIGLLLDDAPRKPKPKSMQVGVGVGSLVVRGGF